MGLLLSDTDVENATPVKGHLALDGISEDMPVVPTHSSYCTLSYVVNSHESLCAVQAEIVVPGENYIRGCSAPPTGYGASHRTVFPPVQPVQPSYTVVIDIESSLQQV